jgi:hypothetical protein
MNFRQPYREGGYGVVKSATVIFYRVFQKEKWNSDEWATTTRL